MSKKLVIILSAFLIGLVFVSPHFIRANLLKDQNIQYSPFAPNSKLVQTAYEEMYGYAPEVQEILRGNIFVRDPYTFENNNIPSPFVGQSFPAIIMAAVSMVTGSVSNAFIVSDFIFPALIWIELFFLIKIATKKFTFSIVVATATVFFLELIYYLPYPNLTTKYLFDPQTKRFLTFMRSFNPQLSFLVLLTAYSAVYLSLKSHSRKILVVAAVVSGLLFYTYIYYWTTFIFSLFILTLYFLIKKDYLSIKTIVIISISAVLIGGYYFYQTFLFKQTPMYTDLLTRITPYNLRLIPDYFLRYFVIAMVFILWPRKRSLFDWLVFSILISTVFLPVVITTILKQDLQGFHYIRRVFFPFSIIAMGLIAYDIATKIKLRSSIWKKILLFVFASSVFLSIAQQYFASKNTFIANGISEDKLSLYSWLNNSTKPGSVVGTFHYQMDFAISANTHNYIFIPPADVALETQSNITDRHEFLRNVVFINNSQIPRQKLDYVKEELEQKHWSGKTYQLQYFIVPKVSMPGTVSIDSINPKFKVIFQNSSYAVFKL